MDLTVSKLGCVPSGSDTSSNSCSSGSMLLTSLILVVCFLFTLSFVVAFDAAAVTRAGLEGFKLALLFLRTFLKFRRVCCLTTAAFLLAVGAILSKLSRVANWWGGLRTTDDFLCAPPIARMLSR